MQTSPGGPKGPAEEVIRGYNLMTLALLGLAGLAFGSVVAAEPDFNDKIDDLVLLAVAAAALIWYLMRRNRFRLTPTPLVLAAVAFLGEFLGVFLEHHDAGAVGDNIGGIIFYVGTLIVLIAQYVITARRAAAAGQQPDVPPAPTS